MNKSLIVLLAALFAAALLFNGSSDADAKSKSKKLLRHVVLFKFKDSAKPAEIQKVVDAFAALPSKIDAIHDFEMGTDVGVENKARGFTHGFIVTFRDAQGRTEYLPHPAHEAFKKIVGPVLDDVLVFDFYTSE